MVLELYLIFQNMSRFFPVEPKFQFATNFTNNGWFPFEIFRARGRSPQTLSVRSLMILHALWATESRERLNFPPLLKKHAKSRPVAVNYACSVLGATPARTKKLDWKSALTSLFHHYKSFPVLSCFLSWMYTILFMKNLFMKNLLMKI